MRTCHVILHVAFLPYIWSTVACERNFDKYIKISGLLVAVFITTAIDMRRFVRYF